MPEDFISPIRLPEKRGSSTPLLLQVPERLLPAKSIILGGESARRKYYLGELYPGKKILTTPSNDEPNKEGVQQVVQYKLDLASAAADELKVPINGRLLVASDIMVSRVRVGDDGIGLEENIGKYKTLENILQDLEEMKRIEKEGIKPFYIIHAASGVKWEGQKAQIRQRDFNIILNLEQINELMREETFQAYLAKMNVSLGGEGALKIAGGLELGYLLDIGAVESIQNVDQGSTSFHELVEEAIHFAQVGIDPSLFEDLTPTK